MSDNSTADMPADPLGGAESIHFNGIPTQCETVQLAWEGGLSPVRVEFYQQPTMADEEAFEADPDWDIVPDGMFNVYYNQTGGPQLDWEVNVEAGQNLWVVIVDHTGAYSQNSLPFVVQPSNKDHCLKEIVKVHRRDSLLTIPAVTFLSLFIFMLGLSGYILFLYVRLSRQQRSSRRSQVRPVIERDDSSMYTTTSNTINEPYMIQRQLTPNSGYGNTDENQLENGERAFLYAGNGQRHVAASQFTDDAESPISPATTANSQYPLLKPAHAYNRDTDNYSINSKAESKRLSIKTAATKASSNEEEESSLSRSTSLTASTHSDASMLPQFFPIRLNEAQTGTWRSGGSNQKFKDPFADT